MPIQRGLFFMFSVSRYNLPIKNVAPHKYGGKTINIIQRKTQKQILWRRKDKTQ